MKRIELLNLIDRSVETEERATEQISRDLLSAVEWCGFGKAEEKKIKAMLQLIGKESKEHGQALESLRKRIGENQKEEF